MEIIDFGKYGWHPSSTKRVHIIASPETRYTICSIFAHIKNISVNTIKWKNICPSCKRVYGKDLKQDIIVLKLKGKKN